MNNGSFVNMLDRKFIDDFILNITYKYYDKYQNALANSIILTPKERNVYRLRCAKHRNEQLEKQKKANDDRIDNEKKAEKVEKVEKENIRKAKIEKNNKLLEDIEKDCKIQKCMSLIIICFSISVLIVLIALSIILDIEVFLTLISIFSGTTAYGATEFIKLVKFRAKIKHYCLEMNEMGEEIDKNLYYNIYN